MPNSRLAKVSVIAFAAASTLAVPAVCQAAFSPGFELLAAPLDALDAVVFDDGGGPDLYVAGEFGRIDGVAVGRIARWDGQNWSSLAATGFNSWVRALAVYDDGGGPALYAAGNFTEVAGVAAVGLAKWDGQNWSAVGPGLDSPFIFALEVHDDGDGPELYIGGSFTTSAGAPSQSIVKWDGTSLLPVGAGLNNRVYALEVFDDGGGGKLYAAGNQDLIGTPADNQSIAVWDGVAWKGVKDSSGESVRGTIRALEVHDDGAGEALYVGGSFLEAGGLSSGRQGLVRWSGGEWSGALVGLEFVPVFSLLSADFGAGQRLIAGANISDDSLRMRSWDGATWTSLEDASGQVLDWTAWDLAAFDEGQGTKLFAAGAFIHQGDRAINRVGRWDGASWSVVSSSAPKLGVDRRVSALKVFDDGGGPALMAGGLFDIAGDKKVSNLAKLDAAGWSEVTGDPRRGTSGEVLAFGVFDDGEGPVLYAGGSFTIVGSSTARGLASWDGVSWSPLGDGLAPIGVSSARSFVVFDDGGGDDLYIGGSFATVDGQAANHIARWDGGAFSPLPGTPEDGTDGPVEALAVFDDGDGEELYVGGRFTAAGGVDAVGIARWDGASWNALTNPADGLNGDVTALAVYDDGSGPALFALGEFTSAGGQTLNRIGKWDGVSWSALGGPSEIGLGGFSSVPEVTGDLLAADVGEGHRLYVAGRFLSAGGIEASRVASWDGTRFWPLEGPSGEGLGGSLVAGGALAVYDDGDGAALFIGGNLTFAGGRVSHGIARFQRPPEIFTDGFESGDATDWSSQVP